jgi:hypothetical protein
MVLRSLGIRRGDSPKKICLPPIRIVQGTQKPIDALHATEMGSNPAAKICQKAGVSDLRGGTGHVEGSMGRCVSVITNATYGAPSPSDK